MGSHDANYKRLFSHPRMMEDFLRAFVREPWVADLDFSTLENLGSDFVTDEGELRDGDVVWRVWFRGNWLYVCVLLEFQSTVDPRMALRMMVYVGLLYQKLIRLGLKLRSLEEAFADWLRQVLLPARAPGMEIPELKTMKEVRTMLAERVKEWPKEWMEEGRQKGLEQGLEQGLERGRQRLFEVALGLLERRFGPVDQETRQSLEARSMEELSRLAIDIPTASSLHELGLG